MSARAPDPYLFLPAVPSFELHSDDFVDGQPMPAPCTSRMFGVDGGEDRSPQLRWSGAPAGTKSYAVTVFDPDAPTVSGFWHWLAFNIPVDVTELAAGAGDPDGVGMPAGSVQLLNDAGVFGYLGAAPPPGHGPHRYITTVHALPVEHLEVSADAQAALLMFNLFGNTLARATVTPTFER